MGGPGVSPTRVNRRLEQAPQEGPAESASLLVDLGLRSLDENVGRSNLVLRQLAVTRPEREVPVPAARTPGKGHEKAGPAVVSVVEKRDGSATFLRGLHAARGTPTVGASVHERRGAEKMFDTFSRCKVRAGAFFPCSLRKAVVNVGIRHDRVLVAFAAGRE